MTATTVVPDRTLTLPAIFDTQISHIRRSPLRHAFHYRGTSWLVDLDDLPHYPGPLGALARFEAADHLGDPGRTLRENVDAFAALHGVDLAGGRVLMLANARSLGHVFDPLSVFWCHDAGGALVATIAEVHNTYGERHAYLVHADDRGRARTEKAFYVSPFHPVDGEYVLSLPEPDDTLRVSVTLERPEGQPFTAAVAGRGHRATAGRLLVTTLRSPLAGWLVSLRIRIQGIRLWARRLPVVPRPPHPPQQGVR